MHVTSTDLKMATPPSSAKRPTAPKRPGSAVAVSVAAPCTLAVSVHPEADSSTCRYSPIAMSASASASTVRPAYPIANSRAFFSVG